MFHSVGRIMGWAKDYRKRMILGFVCSFFATWCTAGPVMLAAWALGQMIGNVWGENELSGFLPWLCLAGIIVLILLRFFFTYWKNRLQESIGTERAAEQRMELGDVLKRVSLGYFAKNNLGDILAALTTELSTLELQSMKMVDAVVNGYIQVAVILLCVAIFCPSAALVALIGVLVSAFALRGIGRQSARTAPVSHRAQEALSGAAVEYIHGLPVVKSFGQDGVSVQRFRDACRDNKAIRIKNEFGFVPWNCLHLFALRAASVGLVLTAGQQALVGALPLPYFLMIALFSFTIFGSVEAINDAAHILSVTDSVLDRLEELERTDFIDKDGREITPARFDVALSHVSVSYTHLDVYKRQLHSKLHTFHGVDEGGGAHQGGDDSQGQHQAERHLGRVQYPRLIERDTRRKRPQQGGRQNGQAQIHGGPGAAEPSHGEVPEGGHRLGKFLIGPLPLAERFHHLNALYIFHDHAVHMGVGFHVGGVVLVVAPHPEGHGDERHRNGHQQSKAHPPVDGKHGDDHDQRQQKIGTEFRDHVSQRRFHIFNTVHNGAFHGANGPAFHLAQRRPHQPGRHLKAQALQNRVGGYMGQHGGQGISRHLDGIAGQTHAAPKYNALPVRLTLQKQPDDLINTKIRYKASGHTENRQYHRPGHLPPAGCGEGEQDTEPSSFLHVQYSSQRKIVVVCFR